MLKVGLTGGIGSGKTTVAKIFETLGVPVYYADEAARHLMNTDPGIREAIIEHFGSNSYNEGQLNRKYVASIVFNDKEKLELLNSITHPATISHASEWIQQQNTPYIIKEAALMFESDAYLSMDKVIGVHSPLDLRIERTMQRDHVTREEVLKRIHRQMDEDEKMNRCDFVMINDEKQLLIPQVIALHEEFMKK
jgi:dephospho-CoA kinase